MLARKQIAHFLSPQRITYSLLFISLIASIHRVWVGKINNYLIFSRPFKILMDGGDPYLAHPEQFYDFYRYSPAFAILFAPLSLMPDFIGAVLWNMLNVYVLIAGIFFAFPSSENRKAGIAILIVFLESLTATQNCQSNGLVAGLILLGYGFMERGRPMPAALFISLSAFIKIYGIAAAIIFLFYQPKKKFLTGMTLWVTLLAFLPLALISRERFIEIHQSWYESVVAYKSVIQLSVMGLLHAWLNIGVPSLLIQLTGLAILLLPLVRYPLYDNEPFRRFFVASLMIFMVIFNQMAESPTYLTALAGVGIWYASSDEYKRTDTILLLLVLVLASLSPTDLFPKFLRDNYIVPYKLKAFPLLLVWVKLQVDIWRMKLDKEYIPHL